MTSIIEGDQDIFMHPYRKLFHRKSDFSPASNSILLHTAEKSRCRFTKIARVMRRDAEMSVDAERKAISIGIPSPD
jgi:hypothetical protein